MRIAPSALILSPRLTFVCAEASDAASATASASSSLFSTSAAPHLCRPTEKIDLLVVRSRKHLYQLLVRRIGSERTTRLEDRRIYYTQAFLQLCDGLRCQLRLVTLEQCRQSVGSADVVVFDKREFRQRSWSAIAIRDRTLGRNGWLGCGHPGSLDIPPGKRDCSDRRRARDQQQCRRGEKRRPLPDG